MKRLRTILIFLLLGAILNLAVTWFIAYRLHRYSTIVKQHNTASDGTGWDYFMGQSWWGSIAIWGNVVGGRGVPMSHPFRPPPSWSRMLEPPSPEDWRGRSFAVTGHGWPCLSMTETSLFGLGPPYVVVDGIDLGGGRALPGRIIPAGFAINTLFYAVILWLLFPGMFVLRRHLRRRRGQCEKCAYDLRGLEHEACPECGVEVMNARSV